MPGYRTYVNNIAIIFITFLISHLSQCYLQQHLGRGIVAAGAHLTVLDLSDNAFGPNGMNGLTEFLVSASCYSLQELKLHNNGLGVTGGKVRRTII